MSVGIMRQTKNARTSWYSKWNPDASCVLWLPGQDDAQSAVIRDRSGTNNNGTIDGSAWVRNGQGLWVNNFDGANDEIRIAHQANHLLTTGGTLMCWAYPRTPGQNNQGRSIDKSTAGNGANGYAWYMNVAYTVVFVVNAGAATTSNLTAATQNAWNFLCVTFNAAANCLHYKNGAVSSTAQPTGALAGITDVGDLIIGDRGSNTTTFDGYMQGHRIFNRVLSAPEIAGIFHDERHLFGV